MSDLNELFAELKNEIGDRYSLRGYQAAAATLENSLYQLDKYLNDGEFARAEQDAYIG